MTLAEVNDILSGQFYDPAYREYWEQKRDELEQKERRAKENGKYFSEMYKYSR